MSVYRDDPPATPPTKHPTIYGPAAVDRVIRAAKTKVTAGRFEELTTEELDLIEQYEGYSAAVELRRARDHQKKHPPAPPAAPTTTTKTSARPAARIATMTDRQKAALESAAGAAEFWDAVAAWLRDGNDERAAPAAVVGTIAAYLSAQQARNVERNKRIVELEEQITNLTQRLAAVETKAGALEHFKFCGPWMPESTYFENNFVVRKGSLWICRTSSTRDVPGQGPGWTQVTKAGRNGKDAQA